EGAAGVEGFLIYGGSGEPDSLDSMNTTTGTALIVAQQIQETLVGFEPGTLDLVPELAESWEANADSTEWTFILKEGVKFHDGTDFNAEAVAFNFNRLADPEFEFGFRAEGNTFPIFPDIFGGFVGEENSVWQSVEAVDETTVKFTLTRPVPLFPNLVAASYFGLSSPEAVRTAGVTYGTPEGGAVGTGPFVFESWTPAQSLTLTRNEDYWGEKAKMPGVIVRFIADASARLAELQSGAIDFTVNLAPDARTTIEGSSDLQLVELEPFNIAYLSLNINNKPFDDVRVRQAMAYAIDKQAILDGFYGGIGTVADDFLPDGLSWARPTDPEPYAYDPEKAKALLAEAGYADGFSTMTISDGTEVPLELWYMPVSRPYYPTAQPVAEAYATYFADIGVQVELKTEDWGVYLDNWDAGNKNGMVMLGWTGDYGDPNNFLFTHFGPGNEDEAGYTNPELYEVLQQAGSATSQDEAAALFQQAGATINQDMPRIPIVHAPPVFAQRAAVTGWLPNPTGGESFAPIEVAE
ncbi:MAG: ABC transporter substrate-binding protein, partial [Roseiflexaceae bacterium]|nr:ABC transporter substrate-binding protein [Roseiflexaceae bacterium]